MSLSGGPADKLGNRYERWWTVEQFVRILHRQAESIRIEDPNVSKAEFVIASGSIKELHQAKRSHPDGKWSLSSLASDGLLKAMNDELSGNDNRFIFVSGSGAEELKELTDRARQAIDLNEFKTRFIEGKEQKRRFHILRTNWQRCDETIAWELLKRIDVRTVDERSLSEMVFSGLQALFLADPYRISSELRCLADESIHQIIDRDALITFLDKKGFKLRRLAKPENAAMLIDEVTTNYLADARKKLIRHSLIPRTATQRLFERIDDGPEGTDSVLVGKAGSGKTGCVIELVEALRTRGNKFAVLAFRLDRLDPVSKTRALGQQLELEESPVLVLEVAAVGREAVLIVDQLDAVSTTSGRNGDFFESVEGILNESRGLRAKLKIHVVVVCRSFDWENDHRLRRLLSDKQSKIEIAEFTLDEVKNVLSAEGFEAEVFQSRQIELLRLPQNLSLFLDAGFSHTRSPEFATAKELYECYWIEKRRAVAQRAAPSPEQWATIIEHLCEEMTRTQQLSVPHEKLDQFDPNYVNQMCSEGVLGFDGKRYGFSHESFFDYCFARGFVADKKPLIEFLVDSEQLLFRRAQVRQVLTYLRDADSTRYCKELRELLDDNRVRIHIKDLAIAILTNIPDPTDEEWIILEPRLNLVLTAFAESRQNEDKFSNLVWQHFFSSPSWFSLADRRECISNWLISDREEIVNMAVNYLRIHQKHSGDRVAELLEPYVGHDNKWSERLRFVFEWSNLENSRRLFELFLQLIDDGTLDSARGPVAVNSTFWSMLYGLTKRRPDWIPEVIAHWMRRKIELVRLNTVGSEKPNMSGLFGHDDFGVAHFREAANIAPEAFVRYVLPVVLEISDAAIYDSEINPPKRDSVWPILYESENEPINDTCRNSLVVALRALANSDSVDLSAVIVELHKRDSDMSNFLLLSLYTAGAERYANDAIALLHDQPWRLRCGYHDSPYWISIQLIKAIFLICSSDNRSKLETAILGYSPNFERKYPGIKQSGRATFQLMSGVSVEHWSIQAQKRYKELSRKFGKISTAPRDIHVYTVGSPISTRALEKMTDKQWLRAIKKYCSEEKLDRWEHPERGGARELAGMLLDSVKNEPERFARLVKQLPSDTHPAYLESAIAGLKDTTIHVDLKLETCRKAFDEARVECGSVVADLLGSISECLPDYGVRMLDWLAVEHPDPETELWDEVATGGTRYYGGDILTHGINTTRGRAADAIRNLIYNDEEYIRRFRETLERIINDKCISVRSCVASVLLAVASHDAPLALDLFSKLIDVKDDRLLASHYVTLFINYGLREHFNVLRPYIERMLRSRVPNVNESGAGLASIAALFNEDASVLVQEAMTGIASQRLGVAKVAAHNIADPGHRSWCVEHLLILFNDSDPTVREETAKCFWQMKDDSLEIYQDIISSYCMSLAFKDDSSALFYALEESLHRLPGIACLVCEMFLIRFSMEAKDMRTRRALDVYNVAKLIFRTYHQHQNDEWTTRCLNLIDHMCIEGMRDVKNEFDQYER